MRRKPSAKQFLEQKVDTAKFYEQVKQRAPVHVDKLKPLVTYHYDREKCENYMWSMLGNLVEFKLLEINEGVVTIPGEVSNG